jgi:hypothetical protein
VNGSLSSQFYIAQSSKQNNITRLIHRSRMPDRRLQGCKDFLHGNDRKNYRMLRPLRFKMGNNPIKCDGQYEIDLLAIDPVTLKKYHIESSVSASKGFSRLTAKAFNPDDLKIRVKVASARRTLGY